VEKENAPLSEARKLVAQAREFYERGDDMNRENLHLAEDLQKRAMTLDSTDGEVRAAQAQVSHDMLDFGQDRSIARRDALRMQADRAMKLSPRSLEAKIAYGGYLLKADVEAEAIRLLQPLTEQAPNNRRLIHLLARAFEMEGRFDDALAALDHSAGIPGGNPGELARKAQLLMRLARFEAAEDAVAQSLAQRTTSRAQWVDVLLKLTWRGDFEGAVAALEKWPGWLRLEDRSAFTASQVWLWQGKTDQALAVLRAVPRDYLHDNYFVGPKSVLLAVAYEMAGRPEAARTEWETVKKVVERVLTEDPPRNVCWPGKRLRSRGWERRSRLIASSANWSKREICGWNITRA
jgi:tetratricopeptide (TPR) repeat protein